MRRPKTSPSSSELDASRLAPCTPVQADLAAGEEARAATTRRAGRCARRRWRSGRPGRPGSARAPGRCRAPAAWRRMVGKRTRHFSAPKCAGVEPDVLGAGLAHPPQDRLGHDVARREVGQLVLALHEPHAGVVDQERALAADGLADQRLLPARARRRARRRSGGTGRTRGRATTAPARSAAATPSPVDTLGLVVDGVDLADAAGGQHDRPGAHRADAVALPLAHHVQGEPGRPRRRRRAAGRAPARAR